MSFFTVTLKTQYFKDHSFICSFKKIFTEYWDTILNIEDKAVNTMIKNAYPWENLLT